MSRRRPGARGSADYEPLSGLLAALAGSRPSADVELIRRAYNAAAAAHAGQTRKSGDPYITHPVAVAVILAEAGADDEILCAGLLHDTVGSAGYSVAVLSEEFGPGVARLVAGVAGLDGGAGAEWSAQRPGVLMIKLADRLHNMRTVAALPAARQVSRSRDTLEVLVPLAASLGLGAIGAELEDLAAGTISRHETGRASSSGRLLAAAAALLPAATRARWRDEWSGELSALPARRKRAVFAARTLVGVPRLAVTLRRHRRADGVRE